MNINIKTKDSNNKVHIIKDQELREILDCWEKALKNELRMPEFNEQVLTLHKYKKLLA